MDRDEGARLPPNWKLALGTVGIMIAVILLFAYIVFSPDA